MFFFYENFDENFLNNVVGSMNILGTALLENLLDPPTRQKNMTNP